MLAPAPRTSPLRLVLALAVLLGLLQVHALAMRAEAAGPCSTSPFSDVPANHPFCLEIEWMKSRGISLGTTLPDGRVEYRPALPVSRQAMAPFLYRTLGSPPFTAPAEPSFADVPSSHPFYASIEWMRSAGVSTGTPQPTGKPLYKPADAVSRQAMAPFLYRAAGSPSFTPPAEPSFADVAAAHPFYAAIEWMRDTGVSTGTPQASGKPLYKPLDAVSRQAMAAFLQRFVAQQPVEPGEDVSAPPLPEDVPVPMADAVSFLYSGPEPLQKEVEPGAIEPERVAVLRGKVLDTGGRPVSGVRVSVLDRPELGYTDSREGGGYDLAANGGGHLVLDFVKEGFLPLQRTVPASWQDYEVLDDVVMTALDAARTTIDLSGRTTRLQVHAAAPVTDEDGTRRNVLMVPPGTRATMTVDGADRALTSGTLRATEYTVGEDGPASMPGELPPTSAYTYAVELSFDEALAAGASGVAFDRPVYNYIENFVGMPVGSAVPNGAYDREAAAWVPSENGRVLKVLSTTDGTAALDTDGDSKADDAAVLAALGITTAEQQALAARYAAGAELWRLPLRHFTPWDYNYPAGPGPGAAPAPPGSGPAPGAPGTPGGPPGQPCAAPGSVISCESQVLGERVRVPGFDDMLVYESSRVPGNVAASTVTLAVSGPELPPGVVAIDVTIEIAGQVLQRSLTPAPNSSLDVVWDGRDAYGRSVTGAQPYTATIDYRYASTFFATPADFASAFAALPRDSSVARVPGRDQVTLGRRFSGVVQGVLPASAGLGGWTLGMHHSYDPVARMLYRGDGGTVSGLSGLRRVLQPTAGQGASGTSGDGGPAIDASVGSVRDMATGPDGAVYLADTSQGRIRRIDRDGVITTVAGGGSPSDGVGDGGPATSARLVGPRGVAVARDGSLYVSDTGNGRVRRIGADGLIRTIAGGGDPSDGLGDGGPAISARLDAPLGLAVAPDGAVAVVDGPRVRWVSTEGRITTFVGTGASSGPLGDGGPAAAARLVAPVDVVVAEDGTMHVSDPGAHRVRTVSPDGSITTLAGNGAAGAAGDGGAAVDAQLSGPSGLALDEAGQLYVAERTGHRVRRVGSDGLVSTAAGNGTSGHSGDGAAAPLAQLALPEAVAVSPGGAIHLADTGNRRIRTVVQSWPGLGDSDVAVPSEDGEEVYVFSAEGRHLRTLHGRTGGVLWTFSYTSGGLLDRATDRSGRTVSVERGAGGLPLALVGAAGQRTTVAVDANGWLSRVTNELGQVRRFTSSAGGLLLTHTEPNGGVHTFGYDAAGRLVSDTDPAGGVQTLQRTVGLGSVSVTHTTAAGRVSTYVTEGAGDGSFVSRVTDPQGGVATIRQTDDGATVATRPDGSSVTTRTGPDPRFGQLVMRVTEVVTRTPSGLEDRAELSYTVQGRDPDDPLSFTSTTTSVSRNGGGAQTTAYDAATRTTTVTSPLGRVESRKEDAVGRLLEVKRGDRAARTFQYDARGRLVKESEGSESLTHTYDSKDRRTSSVDAGGRSRATGYDAADRIASKTFGRDQTVQISRDVNGNATTYALPGGAAHGFGYSSSNLAVTRTLPDGAATTYTRDADGAVLSQTPPSGRRTTVTRDAAGRATSETDPSSTRTTTYRSGTPLVESQTRTAADGPASTTTYEYDGPLVRRVTSTGASQGAWSTTYDAFQRPVKVDLLDDGATVVSDDLRYDQDGWLTQRGPVSMQRRAQDGSPSRTTLGSAVTDYVLDNLLRPTSAITSISGQQRYSLSLQYAVGGLVSERADVVGGTTTVSTYTYDGDGQVLTVSRNGVVAEAYTYDARGNRTSVRYGSEPVQAATFDARDRILTQGGTTYASDADGFRTSDGAGTVNVYNGRGELLSATRGGQTATYAYDATGRRVARSQGGQTTQYLYGDPWRPELVTAVREPSGQLAVLRYDDTDRLVGVQRGTVVQPVATDHLGSPVVVTDTAGAVLRTVTRDVFGRTLTDTAPSVLTHVGFGGGVVDPLTGWVRLGARDYDPVTGRWTTPDPADLDGGQMNLYAYVGNDPASSIDPTGNGKVWNGIKGAAKGVGKALGIIDKGMDAKDAYDVLNDPNASDQDRAEAFAVCFAKYSGVNGADKAAAAAVRLNDKQQSRNDLIESLGEEVNSAGLPGYVPGSGIPCPVNGSTPPCS